ncbi:MAG TPA: phosphatidate cytidylyltransferase [Candidatus Megaira endosymbiont of Hartmannula sinica]|nr:phosphatidate cytidylyltransferase [Candidatus Megaera endosymbiont of Hartmannula sinica]
MVISDNLKKRIASAFGLGLIFIIIIFTSQILFMLLMFFILSIMLYEWIIISKGDIVLIIMGIIYYLLILYCLIYQVKYTDISLCYFDNHPDCNYGNDIILEFFWKYFYRNDNLCLSISNGEKGICPDSEKIIFIDHSIRIYALKYFSFIWMVDVFAYFGGKAIGGRKLIPTISPGKTWSGFLCGIIGASLVMTIFLTYRKILNINTAQPLYIFILLLLYGSLAQISDIMISYFKRRANVKDSGNIIPGHGGMLDRFDSIILTFPFFFLLF